MRCPPPARPASGSAWSAASSLIGPRRRSGTASSGRSSPPVIVTSTGKSSPRTLGSQQLDGRSVADRCQIGDAGDPERGKLSADGTDVDGKPWHAVAEGVVEPVQPPGQPAGDVTFGTVDVELVDVGCPQRRAVEDPQRTGGVLDTDRRGRHQRVQTVAVEPAHRRLVEPDDAKPVAPAHRRRRVADQRRRTPQGRRRARPRSTHALRRGRGGGCGGRGGRGSRLHLPHRARRRRRRCDHPRPRCGRRRCAHRRCARRPRRCARRTSARSSEAQLGDVASVSAPSAGAIPAGSRARGGATGPSTPPPVVAVARDSAPTPAIATSITHRAALAEALEHGERAEHPGQRVGDRVATEQRPVGRPGDEPTGDRGVVTERDPHPPARTARTR